MRWIASPVSNPLVKMRWIALFSQTGSEIVSLSDSLGYSPNVVFTNNLDYEGPLFVNKTNHNDIMNWIRENCTEEDVITLHGYLRILPEDVCRFKIFNGHPGLITEYPELKGKDPQKKALQLQLKSTGAIIHKVVKEIDSGPVLLSMKYIMKGDETEDILVNRLRSITTNLWSEFMRGKLYDKT